MEHIPTVPSSPEPSELPQRDFVAADLDLSSDQLRDIIYWQQRGHRHEWEQARTDELTKIGNRLALGEALRRREQRPPLNFERRHESPHSQPAFCLIDLDKFKLVNDTFGHARGDVVLQEVVRRFQIQLRESDNIFRIGGDEFVILLGEGIEGDEQLEVVVERLEGVASDLLAEMGDLRETGFGISIGASLFDPARHTDFGAALQEADTNMYAKKQKRKNKQQ